MNELTTEAFSVICRDERVFDFTQKYGLHGVAVFEVNDLHDKCWFNPKLLHSLGITDAEGLSWEKWISPDDVKQIEKILDTPKPSAEFISGQIGFLHSKGFSVPMNYKALRIDQKVVLALKKESDYAHIKNNPELDFQREQLLETVLQTIDVGIIACDKNGKLTLFNKTAKKWHGLPAEDIPQTEYASYYNLYEPDGSIFKFEDIPLISILNEGVIRKNEMIVKPASGKERFFVINGARMYDEQDNLDGAVIAMYDITERKKAQNQLSISENLFKGTFENAADGMAISDLSGKWMELNDSLCRMLGYREEELKDLNFLDITHPEDVEGEVEAMQELLNSESGYIQKQKRFISKNGGTVPVILSVSVVRDTNADPIYFIAQMTDISELKSAHQEIARMLNITTDQNERLKNFTQIVSHDLRSHSGNLEMLLNIYTEENPEAKENEVVKMALMASKQLKDTLEDLIKVAFTDLAESEELVRINLRENVNQTLGSINGLIRTANLQVKNEIPEEVKVLSLPNYMESIILNFATNAVKYRSLKREPILHFEAEEDDQYIQLTIRDNGIGIDLEKYGDKLFGMNNTFHDNLDSKGIGLFLTKNQIEAIGGKVEVESEVDKGTTFTIQLQKG